MANWKLETVEKKSVIDTEMWGKGALTIDRVTVWRWGEAFIDSDEKPDIDLTNEEGFNILNSEYDIELGDFSDGDLVDIVYPDEIDETERTRLEDLWDEEGESGWEEDGWVMEDRDIYFNGELDLVNMDTLYEQC
jgi:hypothetical protein